MAEPRVCILRAAGVNCNEETAHAFELAGATTRQIHVNRLLESPALLDDFGAVAVPGGFSYGDDISAGQVLAVELSQYLGDALQRMLSRGGLILGICNGFQVLIKSGLLPGPETGNSQSIQATLVENESNHYEDRWVHLTVDSSVSQFFDKNTVIELPVAHAEGRFVAATPNDLTRIEKDGRAALRYVDARGDAVSYPENPNGSMGAIAGICDATGQVLGIMPHPERYLQHWQHPRWTRSERRGAGDGLGLFKTGVRVMKGV